METLERDFNLELDEIVLPKRVVQDIHPGVLQAEDHGNFREWFESEDHEYVGKENTICGAPMSYFYLPSRIWALKNVYKYELEDWNLRSYHARVISDDELLSKLGLLKGKVLGCWCRNKNNDAILKVTSSEFEFSCHAEILVYLINLFSHPDGKSHWKITNAHWSNTYNIDYEAFLNEDDYFDNQGPGSPGMHPDNYKLRHMFNFDKWNSRQCLKNSEDPCLCFECRLSVFENGHLLRKDDNLYMSPSETAALPPLRSMGTVVREMAKYMKKRRSIRVPLREISQNARFRGLGNWRRPTFYND